MTVPVRARSGRFADSVTGVIERNIKVARRNWGDLLSGFVEPVLYLVSLGYGLGRYVDSLTGPAGRPLEYAAFLAPSMLAVSMMNGAVAETTYNIYSKMKMSRYYDGILSTPVSPRSILVGETLWAGLKSVVYGLGFLGVTVLLGLVEPRTVATVLPLLPLAAVTFALLGLTFTAFMRSWQDFDYLNVALISLFLLSGTIVPLDRYPPWVQAAASWSPLYQAVTMLRDVMSSTVDASTVGHAAYLAVLAVLALFVASRRLERVLQQ